MNRYTAEIVAEAEHRFWPKVDRVQDPVSCWSWKASLDCKGYARFRLRWPYRSMAFGHRVAWVLAKGEIPDGMHVLHKCDNPACVRPFHLRLGTHTDNMRDMAAKGRGTAKFSVEELDRAVERCRSGETQTAVAKDTGISLPHLNGLIVGRFRRVRRD